MPVISRNMSTICNCGAVAVVRVVQTTQENGYTVEQHLNMCQSCAKQNGVDVTTMFRDEKNA
jgi:hypothetical protein